MGAIVHNNAGQILVVQRAHAPSAGLWSIPGGRVEPGETLRDAAAREVLEETGLTVTIGEVVGMIDLPGPDGQIYDVTDFAAVPAPDSAAPVAGDDAADVRWVSLPELRDLPTTSGLIETLTAWETWPDQDG